MSISRAFSENLDFGFGKNSIGPKNQDFCLFEKQDLSKKSGFLCVCKKGTVLKIRLFNKIRYTCEN